MALATMNDDNVFVRLDEYREVYSLFEQMKKKMEAIKSTLQEIDKLKSQEEAELEIWRNSINEIEQRIQNIEKSIFHG